MTPAVVRWIVRRLAPRDVRDVLLDDLDEAGAKRTAAEGPRAARRWYRRQALASIGPLVAMRVRSRRDVRVEERPAFAMDTLRHDLRYALRLLRRSPGFALAAIATVALGIGANTAIFSVVHGLLLKPLPYPNPDRLVMLWQDMRSRGGPADEWATPGNFADWSAERRTFQSIAALTNWRPTLSGAGDPEPIVGEQATSEYFDVLATRPALGRLFRPEDSLPNAARVVVLGHALWTRRFGSDPAVVGRSIVLGGEPHEVIGVAAPFRPIVSQSAELWRPLRLNLATPSRGAIVLRVAARLAAGVTIEQANASMANLAGALEQRYPQSNTGVGFVVEPLHDRVVGQVRPGLLVLLGAVVLVLLVACVNIANLLLARSSGRTREMTVRAALGARRSRVVRQLLTESLLLATIGGVIGVGLAYWGVQALIAWAPAATPRLDEIAVDPLVLAGAAALTMITGMLFGLAPALQLSGRTQADGLRESARGAAGGGGRRIRRALIVVEVAAALVLLIGGGLLLRSFIAMQRTDLGFNPTGVLTGFVAVPGARYPTPEARVAVLDQIVARVNALPGVERAAISSILPIAGAGNGGDNDMGFAVEGAPPPATPGDEPATWYRVISADYFAVMEIPIVQGRAVARGESMPVVVVNQALANRFFNGAAIGKRIRFGGDSPWFTIVGVAGEIKQSGARGADRVQTFIPYWLAPSEAGSTGIVLKTTTAAPDALAPALARAIREVDPQMAVSGVAPMTTLVASSIDEPRFLARITAAFAALALLLASLGVYGVMSYAVTQRLPEMGVRLALGARPVEIFRMVFADGLTLTAIGLAVGAAGALMLGPALDAVLFGVPPRDPWTFAVTIALLLLAATAATIVPARRATAVDPVATLRATESRRRSADHQFDRQRRLRDGVDVHGGAVGAGRAHGHRLRRLHRRPIQTTGFGVDRQLALARARAHRHPHPHRRRGSRVGRHLGRAVDGQARQRSAVPGLHPFEGERHRRFDEPHRGLHLLVVLPGFAGFDAAIGHRGEVLLEQRPQGVFGHE